MLKPLAGAAGQEIQEHYFLKFNADGRLNSFEQQGHVSHIYKKATVDCQENDSPAMTRSKNGFRLDFVLSYLCVLIFDPKPYFCDRGESEFQVQIEVCPKNENFGAVRTTNSWSRACTNPNWLQRSPALAQQIQTKYHATT
jgi:hypothetical protein